VVTDSSPYFTIAFNFMEASRAPARSFVPEYQLESSVVNSRIFQRMHGNLSQSCN